jgi:hypothetical protein
MTSVDLTLRKVGRVSSAPGASCPAGSSSPYLAARFGVGLGDERWEELRFDQR